MNDFTINMIAQAWIADLYRDAKREHLIALARRRRRGAQPTAARPRIPRQRGSFGLGQRLAGRLRQRGDVPHGVKT
ncbi:MAG TPA: hypothetical protein VIL34_18440 [Actinopolymorphaceae bacterium]|jgi:hypothetical protein